MRTLVGKSNAERRAEVNDEVVRRGRDGEWWNDTMVIYRIIYSQGCLVYTTYQNIPSMKCPICHTTWKQAPCRHLRLMHDTTDFFPYEKLLIILKKIDKKYAEFRTDHVPLA